MLVSFFARAIAMLRAAEEPSPRPTGIVLLILYLKKENGGLSDARNYGLNYVSGKYILFIDGDDYLDSKMVELLYKNAEENNSDIVECSYYQDFGTKLVLKSVAFTNIKEDITFGCCSVWNKLYKAELLQKSGVRFFKGVQYEDVNFNTKLLPFVNRKTGDNEKPIQHFRHPKGRKMARFGHIYLSDSLERTCRFKAFRGVHPLRTHRLLLALLRRFHAFGLRSFHVCYSFRVAFALQFGPSSAAGCAHLPAEPAQPMAHDADGYELCRVHLGRRSHCSFALFFPFSIPNPAQNHRHRP